MFCGLSAAVLTWVCLLCCVVCVCVCVYVFYECVYVWLCVCS